MLQLNLLPAENSYQAGVLFVMSTDLPEKKVCPGCTSEKERAYQNVLRWLAKNPERWSAIIKRWASNNPTKVRARVNRWREQNPEWWQKRRADLAKVPNTLTTEEWLQVLDEFHHCCVYCGASDVELTMDHVIPIVRGGPHSKENVVPSCRPCNSRKGAKDPSLFKFVVQRAQAHKDTETGA